MIMANSGMVAQETLLQQLDLLLEDYRDLQAPVADVLAAPPTSLEALRMIAKGHPAVIHGFQPCESASTRDWRSPSTYQAILGDQPLSIAVTDDGYADSVRRAADGSSSFVKPLEERMAAKDFLHGIQHPNNSDILYLQSQDGNIHRSEPREAGVSPELSALQNFFPRDIPWMKEATGSSSEAVNLWIGTSRSVTSMHHDHYENIYHVLSGSKTFTLVSPIEGLWLERQSESLARQILSTSYELSGIEHFHPPATLRRTPSGSGLVPVPDLPPTHDVPWIESEALPPPIAPIVIKIHEGQTLFLPSGWWHRVEQQEGPQGLAVAINYWYPSTLNPAQHALQRMSRRIARLAGKTGVIPVDPPSSPNSAGPSEHGDLPDELLNPWGDEAEDEEWVRGDR